MASNQCEALTRKGIQCKRSHVWTIPNIIAGTGLGKKDWKTGREVHLCDRHAMPFNNNKIPVRLIYGGYLQCYNHHGYGSIVLEDVVNWEKFDPNKKYVVPEFWRNCNGE